jgi:hypothetical protein
MWIIWWCVKMWNFNMCYLKMCYIKMCYLKMCDLKMCYIKMRSWYLCTICVNYDAYDDAMFKMFLIIIWCCVLWCWYEMNYLYAAYTAESYLRWKCRSKSRSYRMFMKFLRCKMLSPCILIQSWGLDALELLLNHDDGAFAQPETRLMP